MNRFPRLHNAMWPGLVGKGPDSEPPIDLDTIEASVQLGECGRRVGPEALSRLDMPKRRRLLERIDIRFSPRQGLCLADCATASEAMLCGSAFCLAGIRWIAGHDIPWLGPITQRLLAAVPLPDPDKQRERRELRAQLLSGAS